MQSWQTDLLNLQLSLSIKPMLRHMDSIDRIRKLVAVSDRVVGRLALPRGTQREAVKIPGARFDAEWIGANDGTTRRVMLYLPGGAYVLRTPNIHAGMVSRLCKCANTRALMTYYRLAPEHPFPACLEDSVLAYRWLLDQGIAGDNVGCLLRGVNRDEIERGQVLAKPGSITPHTEFAAEVYVLKKEEGGRHTPFFKGYRPQFYIRTMDITGAIKLPEGVEMVMPGDNVNMEVELISPVALETGSRFAIREGGRTVGAGVITQIIK